MAEKIQEIRVMKVTDLPVHQQIEIEKKVKANPVKYKGYCGFVEVTYVGGL